MKLTVLHVEDSEDDAIQLKMALDEANPNWRQHVRYHRAVDVNEALAFMEDNRPHMIVLDLNLPGRSGHDLLKLLKSDPRTNNIPVLVLSTSAEGGDVHVAYRNAASAYLVKPRTFAQLVSVMSSIDEFWFKHVEF